MSPICSKYVVVVVVITVVVVIFIIEFFYPLVQGIYNSILEMNLVPVPYGVATFL